MDPYDASFLDSTEAASDDALVAASWVNENDAAAVCVHFDVADFGHATLASYRGAVSSLVCVALKEVW